jgi:hypothetical protein
MLKYIVAVGLAGAASVAFSPAQLSACPIDAQRLRAPVLFARTVNSGEARFRVQNQRYGQLAELGVGAEPEGFRTQLSTDGTGYILSIKDAIDACRFALFTDEQGLIYAAEPMR